MRYIDNFLNSITMFRLVLYGLATLSVLAILLSVTGVISYNWLDLIISLTILLIVCAGSNKLFAAVFKVPDNVESSYITAFILFLLLTPPTTFASGLVIGLAGFVAMASKYVFNINGKHIFNPAAIGLVIISFTDLGSATWWVGSTALLVPVLIFGLLMVRKVRWSWLFIFFIGASIISLSINALVNSIGWSQIMLSAFLSGPIIFFGTIMLTEPSTTPPTRGKQMAYGALTGLLYGTSFHIGLLYNSPEFTLILGNIFSYIVSPKGKLELKLKEKIKLAPLIYDFVFTLDQKFSFTAGQYMEWTTSPVGADSRGNRRYFTIASAPTEQDIRIGVKIPEEPSSFKKYLNSMHPGQTVMAGQLAGDFTLPDAQENKSIVGIAGGIGITPFRSMIKHLMDTKQKTDMVLFYACSDASEFVYQDIFKQAESIGVKTVYVLSGAKSIPKDWEGKTGYITEEIIRAEVPNFENRLYYLSGPNVMVDSYKKLLSSLKVGKNNIHSDYFPGY